jgi:hypothetical protein
MKSLFLAKVIQVYPKRIQDTKQSSSNITRDAYSIDVMPAVGRLPLRNVRVLSHVAGVTSGFVWMPNVDDWVVCSYLENYPDYAICLGTIKHPSYNQVTSEANQFQDCTLSHQSGSWIRMRDLEKGNNPSSTVSRSEIVLHHKTGSEIEMTEPTLNKSEINIKHSSGTKITIDSSGNIIMNVAKNTTITGNDLTINAKNVKIIDKSTTLGDPNTSTAIHTQKTHPICFFTGQTLPGSPYHKCS